MVGRLARYLRFVGCDTEYARDTDDPAILRRLRAEDRILLTRDRALARAAPRAVLLTSLHLADQFRAVRDAVPGVGRELRFERCTECNGTLAEYRPAPGDARPDGVPWDRVDAGLRLFRCGRCGHLYWEGSHTARIRGQLAEWEAGSGP